LPTRTEDRLPSGGLNRAAGRALWKRLLTALALVVTWALVTEGTVRLACLVPRFDRLVNGSPPLLLEDSRLGLRGNPAHPDHDEWGYRNSRPAHADVVVLGDSQTYGTGVDREQAWPAVLGRQFGASVYNMATPNWGAAHNWLELDRALRLGPRLIVLSVYLGNDLYDAFRLSTQNPDVGALVPAEALRDAHALEQREPLTTIGIQLFEPATIARKELGAARRFLSEHSKAYKLASALRRALLPEQPPQVLSRHFEETRASLNPAQQRYATAYDDGTWRTFLTAAYRRQVVDDRDPRVRLGFAVVREAVARIAARTRQHGVRLMVVFIPTKEQVFTARGIQGAEAHPPLAELVTDERRLTQTLAADLDRLGVEHVDLLPALRAAAEQPYFEDLDGHPNAEGHRIIAREIGPRLGI
jgi:lysophospholipase L1-like esterase